MHSPMKYNPGHNLDSIVFDDIWDVSIPPRVTSAPAKPNNEKSSWFNLMFWMRVANWRNSLSRMSAMLRVSFVKNSDNLFGNFVANIVFGRFCFFASVTNRMHQCSVSGLL